MSILKKLSKEASRCVKCGACLASCPIYAETLSEVTTARGKLSLIESLSTGEIQFTSKLKDLLSSCLICNACGEGCPNNVRVEEILLEARKELVVHRGLPFAKKLLFLLLRSSPRVLPSYLKTGSLLQGLLLEKVPQESGLHLRFSLPYLDKRRLIPPLAKRSFLHSHPSLVKSPQEKRCVGYFVGCVTNYLFPHLGETTVRILNRQGTSLVIPHEQTCCGLIAFGSGDWQSTQKLALSNINAFEQFNPDTIITTCASCAATLKAFYPRLFKNADPETQKKVERFSNKIMDISQFLIQELNFLPSALQKSSSPKDPLPTITYHDPCHLNRTLGITREPREILKSLSHLTYVEMKEAARCCGMGGLFNLTHYGLSLEILNHKLDMLKEMGVEMVATSCSGCMLHFMDGIHQRGMKIKVLHLLEVLETEQGR